MEHPHTNWGHVAGAAIGVLLAGGIIYAMATCRLGRLILVGIGVWFI